MLIAAFSDADLADRAVNELSSHGYDAKDLSVISKERVTGVAMPSVAGEAAAAALGGAATGGVIGGLAGLLAGAGMFPALAGFLIGGPVAAALGLTGMAAAAASGAVTGAAVGGLLGGLMRLGLPREEAEYYTDVVEKEGVLLIVPFDHGGKAEARHILEANNAVKVQEIDMQVTPATGA